MNISEAKIKNEGILLNAYLNQRIESKESELFVYQNDLAKILKPQFRQDREENTLWFYEKRKEFPITIKYPLYEKNEFYGYMMDFCKDYITLYDLLWSHVSLQERKRIARLLVSLSEKLFSYQKCFFDWHSHNFLVKEDMKFLDFDTCTRIVKDNLYLDRRNLFELVLSVLIGIDLDFDLEVDGNKNIQLFYNLLSENSELEKDIFLSYDFMKKEIESYTNEKVRYKRELILKSGLVED